MKIRGRSAGAESPTLQMTAMIDIVFLLLIFFVMTFRVAVPEGDFMIRMPVSSCCDQSPPFCGLPPFKLRMQAAADGTLAGITLNDRDFDRDFEKLHNHIIGVVGDERGPGSIAETAEVELVCDHNLHYENVIKALTAVAGHVTEDRQVVTLIEKVKFSPYRKSP